MAVSRHNSAGSRRSIDSEISFDFYGTSMDEPETPLSVQGLEGAPPTAATTSSLPRSESTDTGLGINDSITNFSLFLGVLCDVGSSVSSYVWETATSLWQALWTSQETSEGKEHKGEGDGGDVVKGAAPGAEEAEAREKAKKKLFNICNELTKTEEAYVYRLGILVRIKAQTAEVLNPEAAKTMFQNIEVIHLFHKDNLLPLLQERINDWEITPRIGDIMKKLVPFLKLYSQYVKSFEFANETVESWKQKSTAFAAIVREAELNEDYGKVKLQGHMLDPIQRVPRYELLLREYLKYLPEDDADRADAEKALKLVAEAASHFEEDMKRDSRVLQLIRLQAQLEGPINIIDSSRDFIMSGHLKQIKSPGRMSERMLHLFSDILLVSGGVRSIIPGVSERYRVKEFMKLHEIQVITGNNLDVPHTFHIKSPETTIELAASNGDEKIKWQTAICKQIIESQEKMNSIPKEDQTLKKADELPNSVVLKSGFLYVSSDGGRSFKKRWCVLTDNGVLASYKNMHEKEPVSCISLSCFQMTIGTIPLKKRKMWTLAGEFRTYHIHSSENDEKTESWCRVGQDIMTAQEVEAEDTINLSFTPRQWKLMSENPRMSTVSTDSGIDAETGSTDI